MAAIRAHFDGTVFVPDEPVPLHPGERVVIQRLGDAQAEAAPEADISFVRKLNINLDPQALREIVDDPELSIENF